MLLLSNVVREETVSQNRRLAKVSRVSGVGKPARLTGPLGSDRRANVWSTETVEEFNFAAQCDLCGRDLGLIFLHRPRTVLSTFLPRGPGQARVFG